MTLIYLLNYILYFCVHYDYKCLGTYLTSLVATKGFQINAILGSCKAARTNRYWS